MRRVTAKPPKMFTAVTPTVATAIHLITSVSELICIRAPITMMLRLGTGQVPWWDVLVAALALAAGVYIAIRISGALMRLGLLMYGKRPSLREIFRQLRHA